MKTSMIQIFLLMAFSTLACAAEDIPPSETDQVDELEPQVTIVEDEKKTTYEYRINGQLYMTKIVPSVGPAYYLLDLDGDGEMDEQRDDPGSVVVPQWVLLRW